MLLLFSGDMPLIWCCGLVCSCRVVVLCCDWCVIVVLLVLWLLHGSYFCCRCCVRPIVFLFGVRVCVVVKRVLRGVACCVCVCVCVTVVFDGGNAHDVLLCYSCNGFTVHDRAATIYVVIVCIVAIL